MIKILFVLEAFYVPSGDFNKFKTNQLIILFASFKAFNCGKMISAAALTASIKFPEIFRIRITDPASSSWTHFAQRPPLESLIKKVKIFPFCLCGVDAIFIGTITFGHCFVFFFINDG